MNKENKEMNKKWCECTYMMYICLKKQKRLGHMYVYV